MDWRGSGRRAAPLTTQLTAGFRALRRPITPIGRDRVWRPRGTTGPAYTPPPTLSIATKGKLIGNKLNKLFISEVCIMIKGRIHVLPDVSEIYCARDRSVF